MPCRSEYMERTYQEIESVKVIAFLREVGKKSSKSSHSLYGRVNTLHRDTAELCDFCKNTDMSKQSLDLQIWWRDHQKADKKREKALAESKRNDMIRKRALAKLTPTEIKLLGIKRVK